MTAEIAEIERPGSLWQNADFLRLWSGETISQIGSQVSVLALPLTAIIALHASPQQVGFLTAAQFAPFLVVTLIAGVWLDTHRRRGALLWANVGRCILLPLVPLLQALDHLTIPLLCGLAFVIGTLTAIFDVAYLIYLPSLVDDDQLVEANAKLEATYLIGEIGGRGLGGWLVQTFTAPMAVLADSVTYAAAAVSVASIQRPEPPPPPRRAWGSLREDVKAGLEATFRHPLLLPLTVESAWFNLFEQWTMTLTFVYAVRTLDLSSGLLGAVLAGGSVGGFAGTFFAPGLGRRLRTGRTLVASILLSSAGLLVVPLAAGSRAVVVMLLTGGFAVYGFGSAVYNVHSLSLRIATTPVALRARVTASYRFAIYGTIPLGALFGGSLAGIVGLRTALAVAVAALIIGSAAFAFTPIWTVCDPYDHRDG